MSFCEYCGKKIKEGNRFCRGHNNSKNNPGFKTGDVPWNKGFGEYMEGDKNPFYGKKHNEISNQKNREKHLGLPSGNKGKKHPHLCGKNNPSNSPEVKEKIRLSKLGIARDDNCKDKISNSLIGNLPWNINKNHLQDNRILNKENHWNWKGGISKLPYCEKWTEELREEIRERDNRICQNCGKTEIENGRKLSVHHIHYKKEDCYPDLIALCINCNVKANKNREYWIKFYMDILEKRGLLNYFGDIK